MIPGWLQEKLASVPTAGAGIHAWLFSVARQLHAHMPPQAVEAVLTAATANAGRRVTAREIRDAVRNSHAVKWEPNPKQGAGASKEVTTSKRSKTETYGEKGPGGHHLETGNPVSDRWPRPDQYARECRRLDSMADGVGGLYDLWEQSPVRMDEDQTWTVDDWLDVLLPGAEWLCLAVDHPATARSRKPEKWYFGPAEQCGLVVPSPMTGPSGIGLDGKRTHRCLDNTGPRRWLVIEFDSGTIDEQAALHWHLRTAALAADWPRLALCVHSGGKSLHGWYGLCGDEERSRDLMAYAASLGADTATWTRCQLVRLPGGIRNGQRLETFYFDPIPCSSPNNSLAHGAQPV